jgi:hypothetical protein
LGEVKIIFWETRVSGDSALIALGILSMLNLEFVERVVRGEDKTGDFKGFTFTPRVSLEKQ